MALFDTTMAALAKTLTGVVGSAAIIRRTIADYDELRDKDISSFSIDYPVKTSPPARYSAYEVSNSSVLATDLKVIVARLDAPGEVIDPVTDAVLIAGVVYHIVSVGNLSSGDATAAFVLQLRG